MRRMQWSAWTIVFLAFRLLVSTSLLPCLAYNSAQEEILMHVAADLDQQAAESAGVTGSFGTNTGNMYNGKEWRDTDGELIQAHGGGILFHKGTYYWYGENKAGPTYQPDERFPARVDVIGFSCYSSKDLQHWKNHGLVLPHSPDVTSDLHPSKVAERPKVLYNDATGQFVMWMHIDSPSYEAARVGVAVSDDPITNFQYLGSFRPHDTESRDLTVFKDDDGIAYLVYSSENNMVTHIAELTDSYTGVKDSFTRVFINLQRESPAVIKHKGLYYIVTSGCSGWWPNAAEVHVAASMMGPWHSLGNPCKSSNSTERETTFNSQGSYVLPLPGKPGQYVFMADRWNPDHLGISRYVWLPLEVKEPIEDGSPLQNALPEEKMKWSEVSIRWVDKWAP